MAIVIKFTNLLCWNQGRRWRWTLIHRTMLGLWAHFTHWQFKRTFSQALRFYFNVQLSNSRKTSVLEIHWRLIVLGIRADLSYYGGLGLLVAIPLFLVAWKWSVFHELHLRILEHPFLGLACSAAVWGTYCSPFFEIYIVKSSYKCFCLHALGCFV